MTEHPFDDIFTPDTHVDPYELEQNRKAGEQWSSAGIPRRFAAATTTQPTITTWAKELVSVAANGRHPGVPVIRNGPSLLILGPVGSGKTYEAYAVLRTLATSGAVCKWLAATGSDYLKEVGPRGGVDTERIFESYAGAHVLLLDDIGSRMVTEWAESELLRIIDRRYVEERPTILTSNVKPDAFIATFGARITSRLTEMCVRVALASPDRRKRPE